MQIYNEEKLLDQDFRAMLIEEIEGEENVSRKKESFKRYEIYRDRIKKYILENLSLEMDEETVNEMQSRIATVNMFKKMVQKKARVYKNAPIRTPLVDGEGDYISSMVDLLNLNSTMKKVDRYKEAFRNVAVYNKPYKNHAVDGKWAHMLEVLAPHQFDVVEDQDNRSMVRAVILSHYSNKSVNENYSSPQNRNKSGLKGNFRDGDGKQQVIADSPGDENKEYVFWSKNYHFTCNAKGEYINKDDNEDQDRSNPVNELPFTFFSKDQDNSFWSTGGEDIVDGSILINTLLTDLYFIAKVQGMGLFYMFGSNVPKTFKIGPNKAITMKVEEGEVTPSIGFASSNPPIGDHMTMIEQYVAFLLSTNDLGVNSIQGKLDGSSASSGIQEIIQNSEPMTAIEDEQEQYMDKESNILKIGNRWQQNLVDTKTGLSIGFNDIGSVDEVLYMLEFDKPQHFSNEVERLTAMKSRIDIGTINKVDAMIEENPKLSREDALESLLAKHEENMKLAITNASSFIDESTNDNEDEIEDGESGNQED